MDLRQKYPRELDSKHFMKGLKMKLKSISHETLLRNILSTGISEAKYNEIEARMAGKQILFSNDTKFTIVVIDDRVGVAKRCTYAKKKDEMSLSTGLAIATSRALLKQKF